jgi:uncharacterized protein YndB with AHSA1/START domain
MNGEEMMTVSTFVARAATDVAAAPDRVWAALTEPEQIATYMAGSRVTTTWKVGAPITWEGQYDGHSYQDRGTVLHYDPPRKLSMTHYSPMTGQPDEAENYHTLVYTLTATDAGTHLELTQDGNDSHEQAEQFSRNWQTMLEGLKAHVEAAGASTR